MNKNAERKNIVYLLGAGASAYALPLVKRFKDENNFTHISLIEELTAFSEVVNSNSRYKKYYELCVQARDFLTPDTFAKFLFVNEKLGEYKDLKSLISAYFFFRERIEVGLKPCVDKRVLSFLTTLCDKGNWFPQNVKILTWNYDNQFYIASEKFKYSSETKTYINNLKSFPFSYDSSIDKSSISLVHLNGIAGFSFHERMGSTHDKRSSIDHPTHDLQQQLKVLTKEEQIIQLFSVLKIRMSGY